MNNAVLAVMEISTAPAGGAALAAGFTCSTNPCNGTNGVRNSPFVWRKEALYGGRRHLVRAAEERREEGVSLDELV
jgi:hypothetical protein